MAQQSLIPVERIETKIFMIRGQKVMLSMHLADLYEVGPALLFKRLNEMRNDFPMILCFN